MKQQLFYVSKNGSHEGPYSKEQILSKIRTHEHEWTDYLFDDLKNGWMPVIEHV